MNNGIFDFRKKIAFVAALVFLSHSMCVLPAAEVSAVVAAQTDDHGITEAPDEGAAPPAGPGSHVPEEPEAPEEPDPDGNDDDTTTAETTTVTTTSVTTAETTTTTAVTTAAKKTYRLIADNADINETDTSFLIGSVFRGYFFGPNEIVSGDHEKLCTVPADQEIKKDDVWAISNQYLFIFNEETSTDDELHFTVYYKYSLISGRNDNTGDSITISPKESGDRETRGDFEYYKAGSELIIAPSDCFTVNGSSAPLSVKLEKSAEFRRENRENDQYVLKNQGNSDIVVALRCFVLNLSSNTDYTLEGGGKRYPSGNQRYTVRWSDIDSLSVRSGSDTKKCFFNVKSGGTEKLFSADENGVLELNNILEAEEFRYKNNIVLTVSGVDESVRVIVKYEGSDDVQDTYYVPVRAANAGFTYEVPLLCDEDRFLNSYIYAGNESDIYQNIFTELEKKNSCISLGYRNDMTSVTLIYKKFTKSGDDDAFIYKPDSSIVQRSENCYTIESMDTSVELMKFGDDFQNKRAIINTLKNGALKSESYVLKDKNKKIVMTIDDPEKSGFILVRNLVDGEDGNYTDSLKNSICFYLDRTAPKISSVHTSADSTGGWSGKNGLEAEFSVTDKDELKFDGSTLSYYDKKELQNIYDRFINADSEDSREIASIIVKNYRFDRPEKGWSDVDNLKPYIETEDMRLAEAAVISELSEFRLDEVAEKYSDYENTYGYFRDLLRTDAAGLRSDISRYYSALITAEKAKLSAASESEELEDEEKKAAVNKLKASVSRLTASASDIDSLLEKYITADKNKTADSHCVPRLSFSSDGRFKVNFTADDEMKNSLLKEDIDILAADNSFNISADKVTVHVMIDGKAPVIKNDSIKLNGAPNVRGSSNIFVLKAGTGISVYADDEKGSGVKAVKMRLGEGTDGIPMKYDHSSGSFSCMISESDLNGRNDKIPVIIDSEDMMENKSSWKSSENGEKYYFIIDNEKPVCGIKDISDSKKTYTEETAGGTKTWFSEYSDIILSVSAKDVNPEICSGIAALNIEINGKMSVIDAAADGLDDEKLANGDYRLVFAKGEGSEGFTAKLICGETELPLGEEHTLNSDGSINIRLSATDLAGKTSVIAGRDIFLDSSVPKVTEISVRGRNIISSGDFRYDVFANGGTELRVVVDEGTHSSGIRSAEVTFLDSDGNTVRTETFDNSAAPHNNTFVLAIPADFKGTVRAKAESNVSKGSAEAVSYGIITESYDMHRKTSSVLIELPETKYTDADGKPLYRSDVSAKLTVKDSFSGIAGIDLSAPGNAAETVVNQDGAGEWKIPENAIIDGLVTEVAREITVSENANGNSIGLRFTDNAGNTAELTEAGLSIDKTAPKVSVKFADGADPGKKIFSSGRHAVIEVNERNFDEKRVSVTVNGVQEKLEWKLTGGTEGTDSAVYSAVRDFDTDGDYVMKISCTDRCDWESNVVDENFIIDMTAPVLKEAFDGSIANDHYYNQAVRAVFTITDSNFDPQLIEVSGTYNGGTDGFPAFSSWQTAGRESTSSVDFDKDGEYVVRISGKDKAGNPLETYTGRFCIDTTKPSIGAGELQRSYNGSEIRPRIVFEDTNINKDSIRVKVDGANRGSNIDLGGKLNEVSGGYEYVFDNIPDEEENDDIYKVKASARDNADNKIEKDFRFSVNRYGSVFEIDQDTRSIRGRFISREQDIVIVERNPDAHAAHQSVFITKDSDMVELKEGEDYSVKYRGGDDEWSEYTYMVFAKNFERDAKYSVSIHSRDEAGNINISNSDKKDADIEFYIDKTQPLCIPLNFSENTAYKNESITARLAVSDNIMLKNVKVYIDGKEIRRSYYGDECSFEISNASHAHDIRVVLTDMADNEREFNYKNILVTTSGMRILIHKTWFKVSCGAAALLAGAAAVLIRRRKKRLY